jgi:hypothetical protein
MDALLKRYAPALLPFAVAVAGIFTALGDANLGALTDWRTWAQVVIVLVTTAAVYLLALLPTGWRGAFKVGAPIVATLLTAAVAAVPTGEPLNKANLVLIATALFKIVATQLGVAIRLEPVKLDAVNAQGGTLVGTLSALSTHDALTEGDGLSDPRNAAASDAPKHLAGHSG